MSTKTLKNTRWSQCYGWSFYMAWIKEKKYFNVVAEDFKGLHNLDNIQPPALRHTNMIMKNSPAEII